MTTGARACASVAALLATLALSPRHAMAQPIALSGGFQPDPVAIGYAATGRAAADGWVRGCPGHADEAPAIDVEFGGATAALHLYLVGEGAVGALTAGPDGIYRCEGPDQFGITHLRFGRVMDGRYQLWPLAAEAGASVGGTVLVSELELDTRQVAAATGLRIDPALLPPLITEVPLDPSAEPAFGRLALPGSGAAQTGITLAGGVPASDADPGCAGNITQTRPDAVLGLAAPEAQLAVSAEAEVDTTLLVVAPGGELYCNDDWSGYSPVVIIPDAAPGDYAIWVGVYPGGEGQPAQLSVDREPPADGGGAPAAATLDPTADPAGGRHPLPADGALALALTLLEGGNPGATVSGCPGAVDPSRPDATITLEGREPVLWFHAAAETDTTMIVIGPDGSEYCNDDHDGYNPAIEISDAAPGNYAVWVGAWSGTDVPATLTVGREAPAGGSAAGTGGDLQLNPFAGNPPASAAEALNVLVAALGIGEEILQYERLEETGTEGFVLHGVALRDPTGTEPPVTIGRLRVSDLDLAGLAAYGAPERFAIAFEEIGYAALAEEARANALPLPVLAGSPPFSLALSLLPPDGDTTRRDLRLDLTLEGQAALSLAIRMQWQDGMAAMGPMAAFALMGESLEIELHDMGFLGALLREIAAQSGEDLDAMIEEGLAEMEADMGPMAPGSPSARFHEAVRAKLGDLDRPGMLHVRLTSTQPTGVAELFEALSGETLDETRFSLDIGYRPDG